jgi:hypothetical protein
VRRGDGVVLRAVHRLDSGGTLAVEVGPVEVQETLPNRLTLTIDGYLRVSCEARNVNDLQAALTAIAQLRRALEPDAVGLVRIPDAAPCEAIGAGPGTFARRRLGRPRY